MNKPEPESETNKYKTWFNTIWCCFTVIMFLLSWKKLPEYSPYVFPKPTWGWGRMINDGWIFVCVWTIILTESKRKSVENCVWLPWLISVVPFEPLRFPYSFSFCLTVWLSQEWLTSSGGIFCFFPEPTYITMAPPACGSLDNCTLEHKSCPYGFRLDSSGCRTCGCKTRKWAVTSLEKCFIFLSPYTRCQAFSPDTDWL